MTAELSFFAIAPLIAMSVYYLFQRSQIAIKNNRAMLLSDCNSMLDNSATSYESNGFPIIKGRYRDFDVQLNLIPDTIVMRKVPPLWLMVSIKANKQSKGSMDFIVRPQNSEFYSPGWRWDGLFKVPATWPQYSIAKYNDTTASISVLDKFVPDLFKDEKVKQLLVMPDSLRITYMAKQGIRGEYLLTRGAVFDEHAINSDEVKKIIEYAIEIRKNIEEESTL
ncbi:hypothetical protein LCGC14_0538980 [marine sediment metagenome]|uniref:Uncharacterized protein n=1 Tax=marine sediment metagenome TaxID=412755 RepID=A0A0F9V1I7_9ZZZZ|nr:hypothetical protein [Methylophaga sp.]HEC59178.1 hypothetical protein [Methylophaga sp.]